MTDKLPDARRPLTSRSTPWAQFLSRAVMRAGVTPDAISMLSVIFAIVGAAVLLSGGKPWNLLICAACVQLRLLCNLLDGMVAIEGGLKSKLGVLYNEVPDRIADSLFLVALGHSSGFPWIGWLAALAAAVTAYIRVLGGTFGLAQDFRGPFAKPHRMAAMTVGLLMAFGEHFWTGGQLALLTAVAMIAFGSILTCWTRIAAIALQLQARPDP